MTILLGLYIKYALHAPDINIRLPKEPDIRYDLISAAGRNYDDVVTVRKSCVAILICEIIIHFGIVAIYYRICSESTKILIKIRTGITLVPVSCICTFIEIRRICLQFRRKTKTDTLPSIRALAEKEGFEPSKPFWGLYDFQSYALDQATRLLLDRYASR